MEFLIKKLDVLRHEIRIPLNESVIQFNDTTDKNDKTIKVTSDICVEGCELFEIDTFKMHGPVSGREDKKIINTKGQFKTDPLFLTCDVRFKFRANSGKGREQEKKLKLFGHTNQPLIIDYDMSIIHQKHKIQFSHFDVQAWPIFKYIMKRTGHQEGFKNVAAKVLQKVPYQIMHSIGHWLLDWIQDQFDEESEYPNQKDCNCLSSINNRKDPHIEHPKEQTDEDMIKKRTKPKDIVVLDLNVVHPKTTTTLKPTTIFVKTTRLEEQAISHMQNKTATLKTKSKQSTKPAVTISRKNLSSTTVTPAPKVRKKAKLQNFNDQNMTSETAVTYTNPLIDITRPSGQKGNPDDETVETHVVTSFIEDAVTMTGVPPGFRSSKALDDWSFTTTASQENKTNDGFEKTTSQTAVKMTDERTTQSFFISRTTPKTLINAGKTIKIGEKSSTSFSTSSVLSETSTIKSKTTKIREHFSTLTPQSTSTPKIWTMNAKKTKIGEYSSTVMPQSTLTSRSESNARKTTASLHHSTLTAKVTTGSVKTTVSSSHSTLKTLPSNTTKSTRLPNASTIVTTNTVTDVSVATQTTSKCKG